MSSRPDPELSPADVAERWCALESYFSADDYYGSGRLEEAGLDVRPNGVIVVPGSTRPTVVVTAAHACNHPRPHVTTGGAPDAESKLADRGTGGFALLLGELTGCTVVTSLGFRSDDPRSDVRVEVAAAVRDLPIEPSLVADLHGMRSRGISDVDLGSAQGHVPPGLGEAFAPVRALGWSVTEDAVFSGQGPSTVSSFAQRRGIEAVQVEIAAHLRPPVAGLDVTGPFAQALARSVTSLADG